MAIKIKTAEEIKIIRKSCELVSKALAEVARVLKPGMSGIELDAYIETYIRDHQGVPSFKGLYGFPAALCISVNEEVVHGIPKAAPFKEGDIISVDCGVFMNGYHGDMAYTYGIGNVKETTVKLLEVTKQSLLLGIEQAIENNRTGDIGFAVQSYCERVHKYRCVRELVGHGLGKTLHEDPQVPNFGNRGSGAKLPANCVIAIEPMVNMGRKDVYTKQDKWTVATQDGLPAAHFEHTLVIRPVKAEILTDFSPIEQALESNPELIKV